MRNLKLLTVSRVSGLEEIKSAQIFRVDYNFGYVFFVTPTGIIVLNPENNSIVDQVSLVDCGYLPCDGRVPVVGVEHLSVEESLCVALSGGDIVLWPAGVEDVSDTHHKQLECVGIMDGGLTSMAWSPDQGVVAFTTGKSTLLLMSREFEPILETPMHQSGFGEAAFVNVGWGKKETQFHGSAGKDAAKETAKPVAPASVWDDLCPRISWRGDGQCFVVSSIQPDTGFRQLRVWSREGSLISTSEMVDGLEQALAWKPSGSLIASTQRCPNKHDVVFFEKNGLRHGEFSLPFGKDTVKVREMMWNLDSTVLAVWCEDLPPEDAVKDHIPASYIHLWTVNNYHWYQKQSLHFKPTNQDRVAGLMWDLEQAYKLHVVTVGGDYLQYTWAWATNHSWGDTGEDQSTVAVIDGDKVLMTPMRQMVVPPPMAAYTLQLPAAVNQVVFAPPPFTNDLAVLLVDRRVAIYRFKEGDKVTTDGVNPSAAGGRGFSVCCDLPVLQDVFIVEELPEDWVSSPLSLHHLSWITPDSFVFCGPDPKWKNSVLCHAESSVECTGQVYNTVCSPVGGYMALQLTDKQLLKYDPVSEVICPWELASGQEMRLPALCSQIEVLEITAEEVVLGLTDRFRFYVNDIEVASNCTSFAVHDEYLLLTTLAHTCRCICRNTSLQALPTLYDGKAHPFDESIRRVERGSRIVTVVRDDTKLILQMPRGNLETIHPRALVLSAVRSALDRLEYKTAFSMMKKHRINMNLAHDHNPVSFLSNVKRFLDQINTVTNINIFLTELREEDVTVTMYTAAYKERNSGQNSFEDHDRPSKVDTVCDAVRAALVAMDGNKYLLSILTTYVRKTSQELQAALELIKSLRGRPVGADLTTAEDALKYLLFLVDVNELYDVALGTYDFDLVLMVAEKSQKDPKEYLPFLNNLRRLEENYQRYTIDRQLKRYPKALQHIAKCDDKFNECLSLIRDQSLYREGLALFPRESQQYKDIAVAFGEFLSEKKSNDEAGLMFVKAEEWKMALDSFEKSHNWRQALCMAAILDYSTDDVMNLAKRLARSLKDRQDFGAAALVYEQYVQDVEEAIVTLIEGHLWEESLRLMYKYKRTDFIETDLKPALMETYSQQAATLETTLSEFERHRKRLLVVREEKEKARLEFMERGDYNGPDGDLFSDASSAAGESVQSSHVTTDSQRSNISRSTGRSSRNRRKLERKKWSLKEGSPHEDLALVEASAKLIQFTESLRGDITPLMNVLIQFYHESEAAELQIRYDKLLKVMERSIPEIWNSSEEESSAKQMLGPNTTANSIAQAMQSGQGSSAEIKLDPILKIRPILTMDSKWKLRILDS